MKILIRVVAAAAAAVAAAPDEWCSFDTVPSVSLKAASLFFFAHLNKQCTRNKPVGKLCQQLFVTIWWTMLDLMTGMCQIWATWATVFGVGTRVQELVAVVRVADHP